MAKSLRSKWRRKCRAVKRIRYGEKELVILKKTLGIDDTKNEVDMQEVSEIATVVDPKTIKEAAETSTTEGAGMETDEKKRIINQKSLIDDKGTYPVWMHPRRIKSIKKASMRAARESKVPTKKSKVTKRSKVTKKSKKRR